MLRFLKASVKATENIATMKSIKTAIDGNSGILGVGVDVDDELVGVDDELVADVGVEDAAELDEINAYSSDWAVKE